MALGDPYADLDELKLRVGGVADTGEDPALNRALAVATSGINNVTGRQFNKTSTPSARVFYPRSCDVAIVDDFHTDVGLVIKTDEGGTGTYSTTWSTSDYQLEPLNGMVNGVPGWPYWVIRAVGGRRFPTGRRAGLQVTPGGWGWTAVPDDVHEACLLVGEETYALKDTRFGVGGVAEWGTIRVRANPMAMAMLSQYILDPVKMA